MKLETRTKRCQWWRNAAGITEMPNLQTSPSSREAQVCISLCIEGLKSCTELLQRTFQNMTVLICLVSRPALLFLLLFICSSPQAFLELQTIVNDPLDEFQFPTLGHDLRHPACVHWARRRPPWIPRVYPLERAARQTEIRIKSC